jgi:hypothetical protein
MICRFSRKWTIWGEIKWSLLHFGSDVFFWRHFAKKPPTYGDFQEKAQIEPHHGRASNQVRDPGEKWFRTNWDPGESIMGFLGAWTPEKSEISLSTHHSNLNMEPEGAYTTRNPSSYPYHSPSCCHSAGRHCILPGNCWFTTGQRICCLMSKHVVPHGNSHPIIDLDASNHINQWHFSSLDDLNILKWWHVSLVSSKNIIYPEVGFTYRMCVPLFHPLTHPVVVLRACPKLWRFWVLKATWSSTDRWCRPAKRSAVALCGQAGWRRWGGEKKHMEQVPFGNSTQYIYIYYIYYIYIYLYYIYIIYIYRKRLFIVDLHLNMVIFYGYI